MASSTTLSLNLAFLYTLLFGLIIFLTRLFPFALFSKRKMPLFLSFAVSYLPPMIMMILVIYSLKDISFFESPFGIPELVGISSCIVLHLWKKNAMISIFGSTILYMLLMKLM